MRSSIILAALLLSGCSWLGGNPEPPPCPAELPLRQCPAMPVKPRQIESFLPGWSGAVQRDRCLTELVEEYRRLHAECRAQAK